MSSRHGLEIRRATEADAAGLAELMRAAGRPVASPDLETRLDALRRSPGVALLAQEWGPPGGLIVLHWLPVLEGDRPVALVSTLMVAPDARRRGIGRLLLKAGAQAARAAGCGSLQLAVPDGDETLRAFCDASGFGAAGGLLSRSLRKGA